MADQGRTGREDSSSRLWRPVRAPGTHAKQGPLTGHSAVGLRQAGKCLLTPRSHFTAPSCAIGNQVVRASDGAPFVRSAVRLEYAELPGVTTDPRLPRASADSARAPDTRVSRRTSALMPLSGNPNSPHLLGHDGYVPFRISGPFSGFTRASRALRNDTSAAGLSCAIGGFAYQAKRVCSIHVFLRRALNTSTRAVDVHGRFRHTVGTDFSRFDNLNRTSTSPATMTRPP